MGGATVVAGVLVAGVANGAVGASMSISGQQFKVSADHLHGDGFAQFSGVAVTRTDNIPVATSVIGSANLTNLCQSVDVANPFGYKIVLRIEAGKPVQGTATKDTDATASNMVIGMSSLSGDATFTGINIGV